jgi:uncharacterized membrane protein
MRAGGGTAVSGGSAEHAGEERAIGRAFRVSMVVKAGLSLVEIAVGATLYIASGDGILRVAHRLTRHELTQHPNDVVANFILRSAETLSIDRKSAAALYLVSHGAVKLFLVVMVLRDKLWAYPVFIVALALLIAYQTYRLTLGFAPALAGLTAFDLAVLWLTWHEYRLEGGRRAR